MIAGPDGNQPRKVSGFFKESKEGGELVTTRGETKKKRVHVRRSQLLAWVLVLGGCSSPGDPGGDVHPLSGAWQLTEVWILADSSDAPIAGHGPTRCAASGLDQAFGGIQIDDDGRFNGWPVTDYEDLWTGGIVRSANNTWSFDITDCEVDCFGYGIDSNGLGSIAQVDARLEVVRIGQALLAPDEASCGICATCGGNGLTLLDQAEIRYVYTPVADLPPYTSAEAP